MRLASRTSLFGGLMARPSEPVSLAGFALFAALDGASLAALSASGARRNWHAGATLFQRGDAGDFMLAILAGRVRLSLSTPAGRELVLRHVGPGEVVGEFALIDGEPRSTDAVATEPTSALILQRDRFLATASAHPGVSLAFMKYLCTHLRNTNYQMESIALYDLRLRLVRFVLFTLRELDADMPDRDPVLRLGLNQSDLSAVLGASRPKVNAALQALIAQGALRREGTALVCNRKLLQEIADQDGTA